MRVFGTVGVDTCGGIEADGLGDLRVYISCMYREMVVVSRAANVLVFCMDISDRTVRLQVRIAKTDNKRIGIVSETDLAYQWRDIFVVMDTDECRAMAVSFRIQIDVETRLKTQGVSRC